MENIDEIMRRLQRIESQLHSLMIDVAVFQAEEYERKLRAEEEAE